MTGNGELSSSSSDRAFTLGVVVVNCIRTVELQEVLAAIVNQDRVPDRLVIVDQGDVLRDQERVRPCLKNPLVKYLTADVRLSIGDAQAMGIAALNTDYVYLSGLDEVVVPGFFEMAMSAAAKYPDAGMIVGRLAGAPRQARPMIGGSRQLSPGALESGFLGSIGVLARLAAPVIYRRAALADIDYAGVLRNASLVPESGVLHALGVRDDTFYLNADFARVACSSETTSKLYSHASAARLSEHFARVHTVQQVAPEGEEERFFFYGLCARAIEPGARHDHDVFREVDGALGARAELGAEGFVGRVLSNAHAILRLGRSVLEGTCREFNPRYRFWSRIILSIPQLAASSAFRLHALACRAERVLLRRDAFTRLSETVVRDDALGSAPGVVQRRERKSLSLLICNYNHAAYLPEMIESVLAQSRAPDELLLMDDGSTDGSDAVMRRYAERYPWISVYIKKRNEGYIAGISELTALAKGDFVHRGASDDLMRPNFVKLMMEQAEAYPEVGIVSGELFYILEPDVHAMHLFELPGWRSGFVTPERYRTDYLEQFDPLATLAPSTIFRRDVVDGLGGWRKELGTWDVSFVLHAAALRYGMCYVDAPVYTWVSRPGGWTSSTNSDLLKTVEISRQYYALLRSSDYRKLFGDRYPELWLRANLIRATQHLTENLLGQS